MRFKFVYLFCLTFACSGCESYFMEEETSKSPIKNFNAFFREFDLNYSYFEYKNINWDSVYTLYRPQIREDMSEKELFEVLSDICLSLEDGHVNLFTPNLNYSYSNHREVSSPTSNWVGIEMLASNYLDFFSNFNKVIYYGKLKNHSIGYMWVSNFWSDHSIYKNINQILNTFEDLDGIIIDVRQNGGGSTINSDKFSSRFADKRRLAKYYRYRNGRGHNDFTEWIPSYVEPAGDEQYLKPVVILTNRNSASTAEDFILDMRVLPHVTIVGDTTAGSSGSPLMKELPNGWIYWISNWQVVKPDMTYFEGKGLAPDIPVWIDPEVFLHGTDQILERGIENVNGRN